MLLLMLAREHRKVKMLGHVAEFCPGCRGIREFKLVKYGMEDTFIFIPLGMKSVLGHEATCLSCAHTREVNPAIYAATPRRPVRDQDRLVDETYPEIRRVYADRLRREQALVEGRLAPAERKGLVAEVFIAFERRVQENYQHLFKARGPGLWLLLLSCLFVVAGLISINMDPAIDPGRRGEAAGLVFMGFFAGLFFSVVLMAAEPGRYFRKKIVPAMAKSLRPLEPTRDELAEVLEEMKKAGFKIGRKTRVNPLLDAISRPSGAYEGFTSVQSGSFRAR